MAITRIKNSTISNKTPKYNDVLAGLPFRPIIGTASDGGNGTSASVAFTGNNVANGTITYTALSSPGSFTGTGTASPITVSGLTSGTAYTFQVKAGNSLGDSAYSAASNSVTPVTPTAFESIATATGTGSSGTITFSSIPSTYQHLQIRWISRTTRATNADSFQLTFNGASSTYADHYLSGDGSVTDAFGSASTSYITLPGATTAANRAADIMAVGVLDIHDYGSTTKAKTVRSNHGIDANGSGAIYLSSGLWTTTSAITSITIAVASGSFTTSSTFALYGIKGA